MASERPSAGFPIPWWLAAIATTVGAFFVGSTRNPETPPATKAPPASSQAATSTSSPGAESFDPLVILREYWETKAAAPIPAELPRYRVTLDPSRFGLAIDAIRSPKPPRTDLRALLLEKEANYEFLIATLPDPIDSNFPREFDVAIHEIQRSFEDSGYIFISSWLPWARGQTSSTVAPTIHRDYPGALLFRKLPTPDEEKNATQPHTKRQTLAVVCVVGENPISGVHKRALTAALESYFQLPPAGLPRGLVPEAMLLFPPSPRSPKIRVVGPYYSGSMQSLCFTLKEWNDHSQPGKKRDAQFQVISGTATELPLVAGHGLPEGSTIRATVHSRKVVTRAVLNYLHGGPPDELPEGLKWPHGRIAILRESTTVFGAKWLQDLCGHRMDDNKENNEENIKVDHWNIEDSIEIPFPISISALEGGHEKQPAGLFPPGLSHGEFIEPRLRGPEQAQIGAIPPYDPESVSTIAGEGLRMIMTALDRSRVRYVGIVATDPRDVVYLNKKIREACPNIRVFTTEPHVALAYPNDAYHLRGMVVGSTYPMYTAAERWTAPREKGVSDRRVPFPSDASQGYYNAVLAQLDNHPKMLGYHSLLFKEPAHDPPVNLPEHFHTPPIWISVVGESGILVPVHAFTVPSGDAHLWTPKMAGHDTPKTQEDEKFHLPVLPVPPAVMLAQIGAIILLFVMILTLRNITPWASWLLGHGTGRVARYIWLWRTILLLAVLLYVLPYTFPLREIYNPCCGPPQNFDHTHTYARAWRYGAVIIFAALIFLELIIFAALIFLGLLDFGHGFWKRFRFPNQGEKKCAWGYGVLLGVLLVVTSGTWVWLATLPPSERFFLYVRSTDLMAGLSPIVPMGLLAAAAAFLAWYNLKQFETADRRWIYCPYTAHNSPWASASRADIHMDKNCCFLFPHREVRWAWAIWIAVGITLVIVLVWNVIISLRSGEGPPWDWCMGVAFVFTVVGVVGTMTRLLILWLGLKELLRNILYIPMVASFEHIPDEIRRLFKNYLPIHRSHPGPRLEKLVLLAWALPLDKRDELATLIDTTRPRLREVFGHPLPGTTVTDQPTNDDPTNEDLCWLAEHLNKTACELLITFHTRWRGRSVDEAFGSSEMPKEASTYRAETPFGDVVIDTASGAEEKPEQAERFVAAVVAMTLARYLTQLRLLAYALAFAAPLLLLAAGAYPLQPDRPRLDALVGLMTVGAGVIMFVLYDTNRNGLISRIVGTTPDRFTPNLEFLVRIVGYVAPVLVFAIAHIFGLFRFVLEPILWLFQ